MKMKKTKSLFLALSLCLSALTSNVLATWNMEFIVLSYEDKGLYKVSGINLDAVHIGNLGVQGDFWGLVAVSEERVYTIDRTPNKLYTVSIKDAAIISSVQLDQDVFVNTRGFDVSPDGIMYGVLPGMQLRTINPETGETTFLTNITGAKTIESIAFSPEGTLYAVGSPTSKIYSNTLYQLDLNSGSLSLINSMSVSDIDTLTFAPDGYLYGTDSLAGVVADLYQIHPVTGALTNLGSTGVTEADGLLAVPEPATVLLVGLGGLALRRRRRG